MPSERPKAVPGSSGNDRHDHEILREQARAFRRHPGETWLVMTISLVASIGAMLDFGITSRHPRRVLLAILVRQLFPAS